MPCSILISIGESVERAIENGWAPDRDDIVIITIIHGGFVHPLAIADSEWENGEELINVIVNEIEERLELIGDQ